MSCHSADPRPFVHTGCLNPDSVPQEGTLRASLRIPELDLRATAHRLCPDGPPDQPQEGAEAHAAAARRRCPAGVSGTGRPAPRTAVNALLSPPRVRLGLRRVGVRWRGRPSSGPRAEEFGDFEGAVLATVCRERRDSTLAKKAAFGSRRNGARVFTERRQTCAGTSAAWTPVSSGRPNRRETQHPRRFTGHGYGAIGETPSRISTAPPRRRAFAVLGTLRRQPRAVTFCQPVRWAKATVLPR
jgi:hypothetical protein